MEENFIVKPVPCPLVIVDFMVYAWSILPLYEMATQHYSEKVADSSLKALWAYKINRGPDMIPKFDHRVVIISDQQYDKGGYWRTHVLDEDDRVKQAWEVFNTKNKRVRRDTSQAYKGNRSKDRKGDSFYKVFNAGVKYVETYFSKIFKLTGFEADDIAGLIYRLVRSNLDKTLSDRQKFFSTVDRDWSQLVDEDLLCYWANTRVSKPNEKIQKRLAGHLEVIEHTEYKLGTTISHPSQLATIKAKKGDLGDNLPPGSPIEYFELCEPHNRYNIDSEVIFRDELLQFITNDQPNLKTDHLQESEKLLRKLLIL